MAAIYMWPEGRFIVLTTTLYPVDVADSLQLRAAIASGLMAPIPQEAWDLTHDVTSGTYTQLRWFLTDNDEEAWDLTHDVTSATYIQKRWFLVDSDEEAWDLTHDVTSATLEKVLVEADTPDEKLQLDCVINSSCSMDAV